VADAERGALGHDDAVTTRFGSCELSLERHELRRDGQLVPLEPQVFDVLAYLVTHRERLVLKSELLDQVWGSRFVSESALTSRIKSARRAVGDTGRDQRVIKTVHGRGYRFVADLADERPGATAPQPDPAVDPAEARVRHVVRDLSSGTGAGIQVTGPSGSGRSALLRRAADDARRAGLLVVAAVGAGADDGAGLAAAVGELAREQPELLEELSGAVRDELGGVSGGGGGAGSRQRLVVASRELLLATAGSAGTLLGVDDGDRADVATREVVEEAVRLSRAHRVAVLVSTRSEAPAVPGLEVVNLQPHESAVVPEPTASGQLPDELMSTLAKVALLSDRFERVDVVAATGGDAESADRLLAEAVLRGVLHRGSDGHRFADPGTAQRLVAEIPPATRRTVLHETAERLLGADVPAARVADLLLAAGEPELAAPAVLVAAPAAARHGRHADVLRWTEAVRHHVQGAELGAVLALRADALAAVGDHAAVAAYRRAVAAADAGSSPGLRARMARAAVLTGDVGSAEEALAGLELTGGADDADILLARGMVAYHSEDLDAAEAALEGDPDVELSAGARDRQL
jgi:DNA-binding winged helix-turn-helix (wHTH) protein